MLNQPLIGAGYKKFMRVTNCSLKWQYEIYSWIDLLLVITRTGKELQNETTLLDIQYLYSNN